MAAQIVFLREFLITFYGNEISIGIILAGWLAWGAVGSLFLGRAADAVRSKERLFYICQVLLAAILPLALLGIRLSKSFMGITTGEIVGYLPMILSTFSLLCLPCATLGFMFVLGCRIFADGAEAPAERIARAYMTESAGAIFGGAAVSYILIPYMGSFGIILLLSALNIAAALGMQGHDPSRRAAGTARLITASAALLALAVFFTGGGKEIERFSLGRLWSGFDVLESKNSIYGNVTVTKKGSQVSFYDNGLHLYTVPDPLFAEHAVHFPMLENKDPRDILIIGGGVGGLLKETLKYPVKSVDYVELDPLIINMARRDLLSADKVFLDDPRVRILNEDGRFYVKRASKKYDCVIIALGDPYTAQINRFYTTDFFREIKRVLAPDGIASFALTSSPDYIGDELAAYLASVYSSARSVFPEVLAVPGDTMLFLASAKKGELTSDTDTLMGRMKSKGVETQYMRDYYLFDTLSPERMRYARSVLDKVRLPVLNSDFRPVSYYFATVFWSTQFDTPLIRKFLRSVSAGKIWIATALACALIFVIGAFSGGRERRKRAVLAALLTGGFSQIIFQITTILAFQVIYGYLFYKIGIMITSFMLGLAAGSAFAARSLSRGTSGMRLFLFTQALICLFPLILIPVFMLFAGSGSNFFDILGSDIIFPLLPAMAGIIGGIQFPAANKLYLSEHEEVGKVTGLSYGMDLLGACIGALVSSAFLIPILGIIGTCLLVTILNGTAFALILLSRKR